MGIRFPAGTSCRGIQTGFPTDRHSSLCSCGFCSFGTQFPPEVRSASSLTEGNGANAVAAEHNVLLKNLSIENKIKELIQDNTRARTEELEREIAELRGQLQQLDPTSIRLKTKKEDPDIAELLDNNVKWVQNMRESDNGYFDRIGGPQSPKYLYIGCSDSRVPANQILGLGPGEVFVHRNVGNQIVASDMNALSCVDYAVNVLDVKHIIVTGHYDCGAVKAATQSGTDLGLLEHWLRPLRDIYRVHHQVLDAIEDPEAMHRKFVEVSVVEQCLNLYKTGVVQKRRKETHSRSAETGEQTYPRIHAMVFDPKVGMLNILPIDFKSSVADFRHIYDLY